MKTNIFKSTGLNVLFIISFVLILKMDASASVTSRIEWNQSTLKFVTSGVYARVIKLNNGQLAMAYSDGPSAWIRMSSNNGNSWGNPINVASTTGYNNTNCEIIELANGWLLYAWNGRPNPENGQIRYTINTIISRDRGATWGDARTVYFGDFIWGNGVWEPFLLQLPSGEIQLYFANEAVFPSNDDQEITLVRSSDNGLTWGVPRRIAYRAGSRDGMPVAVNLKHNRGIALAIEDPGTVSSNFKPVIIWTSSADNWNQEFANGNSPRRWTAVALPNGLYAGAPYLVQLPSGETILSIQSAEGRISNNNPIMQVYVGDHEAKNFTNRSTPFTNIPAAGDASWNALTVIDDNTVMAVSSVNMAGTGQNGIYTIVGQVVRTTHTRFESVNFPSRFIRHSNYRGRIDVNVNPATDAEFKVVAGLANASGVSIESVNFPGFFLRHRNGQIWLDNNNGTSQFWADATWHRRQGLSDANGVSFESFNFPGRYIRHANSLLVLQAISDNLGRNDATFFEWGAVTGVTPNTNYLIVNRNSNRSMDVVDGSLNDGANVRQWYNNGSTAQQWRAVSVGNGFWGLIAQNSGKALEVDAWSTANGANIQQWNWLGNNNQQWQIIPTNGSFFRIINRHSGKACEVDAWSTAAGANIHQWDWFPIGHANQQWQFIQVNRTKNAQLNTRTSESESESELIELYPNPASINISIRFIANNYNNCYISIWDKNGRMLINQKVTTDNSGIDISKLGNGFYIVKIRTDSTLVRKKLTVIN